MNYYINFIIIICLINTNCVIKEQEKPPVLSTNQDIPGFIKIDGGNILIGSPKSEFSRWSKGEPEELRNIVIDSFYISQFEVTQKEYDFIMDDKIVINGNFPANKISWYKAIEFCNKLSILNGIEPAYIIENIESSEVSVIWNRNSDGYRLPTSAEWECAIRAGTRTPYYTGNKISETQANFNSIYPYENDNIITVVGSYPSNPWGLYDMAGNVYEWCWDYYLDITSLGRIIRGGSYWSPMKDLRSAAFSCSSPNYIGDGYGFRLARNVK